MRIVWFMLYLLLFAACRKDAAGDQEIVLINADTLGKDGIAKMLNAINALGPKLVAIDFQFGEDEDVRKDTLLMRALRKTDALFMVSIIDDYGDGVRTHYDRFAMGSLPVFLANAKTGFANTIVDENELRTLSRFATYAYVAGRIEYHFGVRVAMAVDSLRAAQYVERHPRIVEVDYRRGGRHFKILSPSEVLGGKISRKDIADKIVMLGSLGPGNEDKFYTPLNTDPDEPDMYGVEYLAHIVAQLLENG